MRIQIPKEYVIQVTEDHIRLGKRSNCRECPVALAVREELPAAKILGTVLIVETPWLKIHLPKKVTEFIEAFDHFRPVEPFSFELKIK